MTNTTGDRVMAELEDKSLALHAATARISLLQRAVAEVKAERDLLVHVIRLAKAHVSELRGAWQRGCISEHDGLGGTRSNRNVDVDVMLRQALAREKPHVSTTLIAMALEAEKDARLNGIDHWPSIEDLEREFAPSGTS